MLNWYKNLYVGDTAKKKEKKIRRKINNGSGMIGVYVITLAANPADHLEIISSNYLLQKPLRARCPMIVGIAEGYEEALELVEESAGEVWEKTGGVQIRAFLENNQKA